MGYTRRMAWRPKLTTIHTCSHSNCSETVNLPNDLSSFKIFTVTRIYHHTGVLQCHVFLINFSTMFCSNIFVLQMSY